MPNYASIPIPSPELLYQISGTDNTAAFFQSVDHLTAETIAHLRDAQCLLRPGSTVLDFGCGVGKILIGLNERIDGLRLHGCDLDGQLIEWCQKNLAFADCYVNGLKPPLRYEDSTFDCVNAISVFTHLPVDSQIEWAWELFRVLKPGGHLHFTSHGLAFFGLFSWIAQNRTIHRQQIHSFADGGLIMEIEQPIDNPRYRQKSGTEAHGQLEVAVAHNGSAVRDVFSSFESAGYFPETSIGNGHDAYVLRKSPHVKPIRISPIHRECALVADAEVTYEFAADGQTCMTVFVAANLPGAYSTSVECVVTTTVNGVQSSPTLVKVGTGERFFGSSHYYRLTIPLPAATGNISVRLQPRATNPQQQQLQGLLFAWPYAM